MAENSKGAPKNVPQPKTNPGSIPVASPKSDRQGQRASVQEGASKKPTVSGHVTAGVKQPGSSETVRARSPSDHLESVSSTSSTITTSPYDTQAKTPTSPFSAVESGITSLRSPESPSCISDAERRLAELTVLRGRKMPLSESELPISPYGGARSKVVDQGKEGVHRHATHHRPHLSTECASIARDRREFADRNDVHHR
ncbi:hypothetical protein MTO96_026909 [Rhipicephalus appendiculatus]